MFKKKPIYIVGVILFTLILIADVAIYIFAAPSGNRGNMPGRGGSFNGEMPEGFGSGSFDPDSFDSSSLPEGFDGSGMPQGGNFNFGNFDGEMPEGFDSSQMPQGGFGGMGGMGGFGGFDGSEDFTMPEDGQGSFEDFSGQMPEGNIPNRWQSNDAGFLSVVRSGFWPILIICILGDALCIFMLVWISKKKEKQDDSDDDIDDTHSTSHTNTVLGVIAILLVGAVVFASLSSGGATSEMVTQVSVRQAEASLQDIVGSFSGSGTLTNSDACELTLPVAVTVTGYTVKNGDAVNAGDVLAYVDKTSVLKAIYEVQALISEMDVEISEVQGNTLDSKITARADGRVKVIYVAEGDTVSGAMYKNGAVILISLGGSMTVVIDSSETVSVGQSLTVTLSDGTKTAGKVQQVQNGKITVTTTDNGPTPDDTVSVATEEGTVLGTGVLSISSPLKITGYWGTVDKIYVEVGDAVETGDTLMTLVNTSDTARYQQLLRERQELTELSGHLASMYQSGTVQAEEAGIVSGIPGDTAYVQLSAGGSYQAVFLSELTGEPPVTGDGFTPPEDGELPPQADGTYAGQVSRVTYGALHIKVSETDMSGLSVANLEAVDTALFISERQYSPELTVPVNRYENEQTVPGAVSDLQAGDRVLLYIQNGTLTQIDYIPGSPEDFESNTPGGSGSIPGGTGSMSGGMGSTQMPSMGGSFGNQTQDEDEEEVVYEVETTSLCAIIPAEAMTIEVSVDELDILSLSVGQSATVALDALPGQSFVGTVKSINPTGTNEGGSTKYTVTMEVPRAEQMLPGMNASVSIEVSRLSSVLTVPAAAVYEDGNRTYVYTRENAGEPTNPIEVTTGVSDGTNVQILSGLSQGETVYYSYADSIIYK